MLTFLLPAMLVLVWGKNAPTACNYKPDGDIVKISAVPINGFRTGGNDTWRTNFCVAHCDDCTSIRASMVINLKNPNQNKTNHINLSKKTTGERFAQKLDDDPNYCLDPTVSQIVDNVFSANSDLDSIKTALDQQLNKPGWAYLIYQANIRPSMIFTFNAFSDVNFCQKDYYTSYNSTSFNDFSFIGGLIM